MMGIDLAKLLKSLLFSAWPMSAAATAPSVGSMAGSALTVASNNINGLANATAAQATAAVGKASPQPIDMLDILISAGPSVIETNANPQGVIAVQTAYKWKLRRDYGGVAWCYAALPTGLYLIPKKRQSVGPAPELSRRLYRFDTSATPPVGGREQETLIFLNMTARTEDRDIQALSYRAGCWWGFQFFTPPVPGVPDPTIHEIGVWNNDGTYNVTSPRITMPWEGAFPSFAMRIKPDMSNYQVMLHDRRGWILGLDSIGGADPWDDQNFIVPEQDLRPMESDMDLLAGDDVTHPWSYVVFVNPATAEIVWWDVRDWELGAAYSFYKRFFAYDAISGGIQDIALDLTNNQLWVLTKDRELQLYSLDVFHPETDPPADPLFNTNTPKGLVPISYPSAAQEDQDVVITYRLLDMWGRPTGEDALVEVIACNSLGNFWSGSLLSVSARDTSVDGLISFTYHPLEGSAGQIETVLARIVES